VFDRPVRGQWGRGKGETKGGKGTNPPIAYEKEKLGNRAAQEKKNNTERGVMRKKKEVGSPSSQTEKKGS